MALVNVVLAASSDGQFAFSFTYDDVTRLIQTVQLVNNTGFDGFVQASADIGGTYYSRTLAAGGSETFGVVGLNLLFPLPNAPEDSLIGKSQVNIKTRWPA
jgi:hypothetical protein